MQSQSLDRKDLLQEGMAIPSSVLPEEFRGQKSPVDHCAQSCKEQNMTEETYTQTHTHKGTKQSKSHAFCCLQLLCISPFPFYDVRVKPCRFSWTMFLFHSGPQCFSDCLDSSVLIIRLSSFLLRKVHIHLTQSLKINQSVNPDKKLQAGAEDDAVFEDNLSFSMKSLEQT